MARGATRIGTRVVKTDVAVIVVNFCTPDLTIACVESVLRSVGCEPRVFVLDNHSTDDSVQRLRTHFAARDHVSVHSRSVNDGYTGGNNAGVELARSAGAQRAFLLNSDATVEPDCVARLVSELETDSRIALVNPRIQSGRDRELLWFGGGSFSPWRGRPVHVGAGRTMSSGWQQPRDLPFATGCALLVRLDAVPHPLFDASLFAYAEDLDLSLGVLEAGRRIRYVPDAVVWHHDGASHRGKGGAATRYYFNVRNLLRVVSRHARWYRWPSLAPMLAVNIVARYSALAIRDRDMGALAAAFRGAVHALTGGRHPLEHAAQRDALSATDVSKRSY